MNGSIVLESVEEVFTDFSKALYNELDVNYPKFFKMNGLSKLAFLAAEAILKNEKQAIERNIALLFSNKSSSLDTDIKHQESIADHENYFPSPAVFVYTLPNMCLGEISIRHELKSENSFFIFEAFNPAFMVDYANILIQTGKADQVLCGWTEYFKDDYHAFVYLVSNEGQTPHDQHNLEILYNK